MMSSSQGYVSQVNHQSDPSLHAWWWKCRAATRRNISGGSTHNCCWMRQTLELALPGRHTTLGRRTPNTTHPPAGTHGAHTVAGMYMIISLC
jgi:hypothetical protein